MFTRFAASTVSTCNNMVAIDSLLAFGPEAERQFIQKSKKYNIDIEDVRQNAYLVYFEKNHLYDATRGTRRAFFCAHLEKRLLREAYGALRYPVYLDDCSEAAHFILDQLDMMSEENDEYRDLCDAEILDNPLLEKCRIFALSISGKSPQELAILWGKSVRRVNQIIAEWCAIAYAERLRTKK